MSEDGTRADLRFGTIPAMLRSVVAEHPDREAVVDTSADPTVRLSYREVLERVDAGRVPFDDVHDDIASAIQRDTFRNTVDKLLTDLVAQAEVKLLFDENIPVDAPAREVVPAAREAVEETPQAPKRKSVIRNLPGA